MDKSEQGKDLVKKNETENKAKKEILFPPSSLDLDEKKHDQIAEQPAISPVVIHDQNHIFCWPEPTKSFSEKTRSQAQKDTLDKLKHRPRINSRLHPVLDLMPGYLIEFIYEKTEGMTLDPKLRTEYLLNFAFQYMGRPGAAGNKRYLFDQKTKRYLMRAINELYEQESDCFLPLDEKTKIGREAAEAFLVRTFLALETNDKHTLKKLFITNGFFSDRIGKWPDLKENKDKAFCFAEELLVILNYLQIEAYTHLQHTRNVNTEDLLAAMDKIRLFLGKANRIAKENGYIFASVIPYEKQDDLSFVRQKISKLYSDFQKKQILSDRQKSYVLALIGKMHQVLECWEDKSLIALIRTRVGILEIRHDGERSCTANLIQLSQLESSLQITRITMSEEEKRPVTLDPIWDLAWLDRMTIKEDEITGKISDKKISVFLSAGFASSLLDALGQINASVENSEIVNKDGDEFSVASEIFNNLQIQKDFAKTPNIKDMICAMLRFMACLKNTFQDADNQRVIKKLLDNIFGEYFELMLFLKKISEEEKSESTGNKSKFGSG